MQKLLMVNNKPLIIWGGFLTQKTLFFSRIKNIM
jgi:hypothetical protein